MFGSLKHAYELTKELTALQASTDFKTKITELLAQLMTAREEAATLQEQNLSLLSEIRDLKTQAAKREDWLTERQRYELSKIGEFSAVAYLLKPQYRSGEQPHALCPQCFNEGKKGFLQPVGVPGTYHLVEHRCSSCGSRTSFEKYALASAWKKNGGENVG